MNKTYAGINLSKWSADEIVILRDMCNEALGEREPSQEIVHPPFQHVGTITGVFESVESQEPTMPADETFLSCGGVQSAAKSK